MVYIIFLIILFDLIIHYARLLLGLLFFSTKYSDWKFIFLYNYLNKKKKLTTEKKKKAPWKDCHFVLRPITIKHYPWWTRIFHMVLWCILRTQTVILECDLLCKLFFWLVHTWGHISMVLYIHQYHEPYCSTPLKVLRNWEYI